MQREKKIKDQLPERIFVEKKKKSKEKQKNQQHSILHHRLLKVFILGEAWDISELQLRTPHRRKAQEQFCF